MTTSVRTTPAPDTISTPDLLLPIRFRDLLLSEWTKLRSVRSTMWALGTLVVATIGFPDRRY